MATILVVDDDLSFLARLGTVLEQEGHEVVKISAISPALVLFEQHQPDLVILEVKTGQDAGWSLLESFAQRKPVLVLSAYGREEDVIRGFENGAIDYITKPYRTAELLVRIRKRLNGVGHFSPPLPVRARELDADSPDDPDMVVERDLDGTGELAADGVEKNGPSQPLFMSEAEEMALLRSAPTLPVSEEEEDDALPGDASPGRRLHLARKKRRITLVQAENELSIGMAYLQAMEEEKFSLLPQGPLATHMLRSYATYLGLDAQQMVKNFTQSYSIRPIEHTFSKELSKYRFRSFFLPPRWVLWTMAVILALIVGGAGIAWFDPDGAKALGDRLHQMVGGAPPIPIATETPTPTWTVVPTATPTQTPQPTLTPTLAVSIPISPTHRISPTLPLSPTRLISPTNAISPTAQLTSTFELAPTPTFPFSTARLAP